MEYVALLHGYGWTDRPGCTDLVVARVAHSVNDYATPTQRAELLDLIPQLAAARPLPAKAWQGFIRRRGYAGPPDRAVALITARLTSHANRVEFLRRVLAEHARLSAIVREPVAVA
ncbi:hypothetical protein SCMU_14420 [Sinomonas cyclohexanicum]|uniref:Uncharacterized protein n=1 Tax=Sinomonas cyclohexanicum TaxID=322009 RepID=A0ABM7PTM1_SINCY|nr:hypothetical protein [Corynebacterium cyclohexanicum]BCT75600.1 hypothetical protein SCMU_14420 [Corynebacterium cyclohexanicum]